MILRCGCSMWEDAFGESSGLRSNKRSRTDAGETSCDYVTPTIFRKRRLQKDRLFRKIIGATPWRFLTDN
jgi:hypothetical protein